MGGYISVYKVNSFLRKGVIIFCHGSRIYQNFVNNKTCVGCFAASLYIVYMFDYQRKKNILFHFMASQPIRKHIKLTIFDVITTIATTTGASRQ